MKTLETKLTRIGNSRGIRLPAALIRKHQLDHGVLLEDGEKEIVLRPKKASKRFSWEETAKAMAAEKEDRAEWDCTLADGLEALPWKHPIPANAFPARKKSG